MRDRELMEPSEPIRPEEWRQNYSRRPIERLPGDVLVAFDKIHNLNREKDQLRADLESAKRKLSSANLKVWVLTLLVGGEGVALTVLFKFVLERIH